MAINAEDIVPKSAAAPAAATTAPADIAPATPAPANAPEDAEDNIPEDVLRIPAFTGLLQGKPAAVSVVAGDKSPEVVTVYNHLDELTKTGFNLYRALDGKTNVFFNEQFIDADTIRKADKKGLLDEIAPPFAELKSEYDRILGAPAAQAAPGATGAPEGVLTAPAAPAPAGAPAPASSTAKLTTARLKNLALGSPTQGPAPGQGRILNNIAKPVV